MLALLRSNREFRRLFLAHSVSRAGDAFNTVALVVLVFALTGSGRGVGGGLLLLIAAAIGWGAPLHQRQPEPSH